MITEAEFKKYKKSIKSKYSTPKTNKPEIHKPKTDKPKFDAQKFQVYASNFDSSKLEPGAVMSVIKQMKGQLHQPHGGLIKSNWFEQIDLSSENKLYDAENGFPTCIAVTVERLSRYFIENDKNRKRKIFNFVDSGIFHAAISEMVSDKRAKFDELFEKHVKHTRNLKSKIKDLNIESIKATYELMSYDVLSPDRFFLEDISAINDETFKNIEIMVQRTLNFFEGQKVNCGLPFSNCGDIITGGETDFITDDTLYDMKVYRKAILNKDHKLQIVIYWILGLHSGYKEQFEKIKKLSIFNPRLNVVWVLDVSDIPNEVIKFIEAKVIGCH